MPSLTSPFKRIARLVSEHVRRLRDSLVTLTAQVRAAVARKERAEIEDRRPPWWAVQLSKLAPAGLEDKD